MCLYIPLWQVLAEFRSRFVLKQPRKEILLSKMAVVVTNLTSLQSWIRMYASSAIQLQWTRFQARYGKNNLQATEHTIARREYHSISLTRSKALSKGFKIWAVSLPKLITEIYSGFLKFESVGEIMRCDYTKETSSTLLSYVDCSQSPMFS